MLLSFYNPSCFLILSFFWFSLRKEDRIRNRVKVVEKIVVSNGGSTFLVQFSLSMSVFLYVMSPCGRSVLGQKKKKLNGYPGV